MIAFSSFRPFGTSPEYDRNQVAAWETWQTAFDCVVYFNEPAPEVTNAKTMFVSWEAFPPIYDLVEMASEQSDWVAIINADICVGAHFRAIESDLKRKKALACTSWRFEFDPATSAASRTVTAQRVDNGLDFFAATPDTWRKVLQFAPRQLRLGCQQWDSWMLGCLNTCAARGFYSITSRRVIFHPRHGDRKYGFDIPAPIPMGAMAWPMELR